MTDFDELAGIALAIFLALTLLIPHLDGADVSTPHPDANRRRAPTDRLRSFEGRAYDRSDGPHTALTINNCVCVEVL